MFRFFLFDPIGFVFDPNGFVFDPIRSGFIRFYPAKFGFFGFFLHKNSHQIKKTLYLYMSNAKNIKKMETKNTKNVENQSINNIKINYKFTQRNNFFVVIARFYNWNSTIVGKYTDKQTAIKCANDYLNMINQYGTGNSHRITEIVIDGSSI